MPQVEKSDQEFVDYLQKRLKVLRSLQRTKADLLVEKLQGVKVKIVKFLAEVAYNILKGTLTLTPAQKKKAVTYKSLIKTLVARRTNLADKKKLLLENIPLVRFIIRIVLTHM